MKLHPIPPQGCVKEGRCSQTDKQRSWKFRCVYLDQAEALEKAGRLQEAMEAFNKCLRAAGHARDSAHAALANYRLGLLSHQQAKWQDAMFYLRRFLDLASSGATSGGDKGAEGVATTTLAHCLQARASLGLLLLPLPLLPPLLLLLSPLLLQEVGNTKGAIQCLEDYLETAARGPEQSGPAVASCSLGILYYAQGAFPRAVSLFERFFEVARGLPDKRMADVARINLGVARAAVNSQVSVPTRFMHCGQPASGHGASAAAR
ncbi:hypothetical protein QJQ45_006019 [Haematococcus lacustris]|nr:hypothetical protein QJQ45_006019 [Haematococcus lacustris]